MAKAPVTTPSRHTLQRGRTVTECGRPPPVRRSKQVLKPVRKLQTGPASTAQSIAFKGNSWTKLRTSAQHFAGGFVPHSECETVASWFERVLDGESLEPTEFAVTMLLNAA
jgi:hypothetical protein